MDLKTQLCILLLASLFIDGDFVKAAEDAPVSHTIPCEEAWAFFGDKCYKVFGLAHGLTWRESSAYCNVISGQLVTLSSKDMQDFVATFVLLRGKLNVWIGLHDRVNESEYEWDDGSPVNYTNWEPGEPSGKVMAKEDCVEMVFMSYGKIGLWNDIPCDRQLPFICQRDKDEQKVGSDTRLCPASKGGGFKHSDECYHVVNEKLSWDDAEKYCQEKFKGHLVTIMDSREQHLVDYLSSNFSNEFWIGIKIGEQVNQKWSSGWHVMFDRWDDSHVLVKSNCALRTEENLWTSAPCTTKLPFMCMTSSKEPPIMKTGPEGWRCPNSSKDWKDLGGEFCYKIETARPRVWRDANYACMKMGGTLATIHSTGVTNALYPLIENASAVLFIGLHRSLDNKNFFEWVDGTLFDYHYWAINEPNSKKEECVELMSGSMEWNDVACNLEKGYICSIRKIPPNAVGFSFKDNLKDCSGGSSSTHILIIILSLILILILLSLIAYCWKYPAQRKKLLTFKYRFSKQSISREPIVAAEGL